MGLPKNKARISMQYICMIFVTLCLIVMPFINSSCTNSFLTGCNADIMEQHYLKYGDRMEKLHRSLYDKLKPGTGVDIEFENGDVTIFHITKGGDEWEQNWDPSDETIDSLLNVCGLDRNSLKWLENEVNEIGCISIQMQAVPDDPYILGFRRVGMGKYSYYLSHKALTPKEQEQVNESCSDILYSPNVVFQYGGGAFGSISFEGKEEYMKKKHQLPKE